MRNAKRNRRNQREDVAAKGCTSLADATRPGVARALAEAVAMGLPSDMVERIEKADTAGKGQA